MATDAEKRGLDLVDRVEFRLLEAANNEEKLQQLLSRYLVPLLLKAASEHASVRVKVIQICQRLKTFIKPPG
jgi:proteasome component ECM29